MSANPLRGEIALDHGPRQLVLRFTANELAVLEQELGMPVGQIAFTFKDPDKIKISTLILLFWASLQDKQPEITKQDAGRLLTDIGMGIAMTKVMEAFVAAFPTPKGGANRNPPRAGRRGTGSRS